jgi:hypothetical protein
VHTGANASGAATFPRHPDQGCSVRSTRTGQTGAIVGQIVRRPSPFSSSTVTEVYVRDSRTNLEWTASPEDLEPVRDA